MKIAAIIYRTYMARGVDIPHFRTIITILSILFLHVVHVGLLFNIPSSYIMPWSSSEKKSSQWLWGTIYFGILLALVAGIFKKSNLEKVEVTEKQINKCKVILPIYLVICILLLAALLIKSGIDRGKINI